jgi:tRNA(adenine34) deaminase
MVLQPNPIFQFDFIRQAEIAMKSALQVAMVGRDNQEVPVGAIVYDANFKELARASNLKEASFKATAHAEILAINEASEGLRNWRLEGAIVVVTLEPCPMCLAAMQQARIGALIFGAYDKKGGAISLGHNLHQDARLNHQFPVLGGILSYECGKILSDFFRQKRAEYKATSSLK